MDKLRKSYLGKKVFVLRGSPSNTLDCCIFTDKNLGGYGSGIRGDYFYSDDEFKRALSKKGDSLKRKVFTIDTLNELKEFIGINDELFNSQDDFREKIRNIIIKTRNSYCSANPEKERSEGVYVEIEDIFK